MKDFQLPFGEPHPIERLIRLDAGQRDRAESFHDRLSIEPLECLPQREAELRPLDVQARIDLTCVLCYTLQVCPQRGAIALPREQFILSAAALR